MPVGKISVVSRIVVCIGILNTISLHAAFCFRKKVPAIKQTTEWQRRSSYTDDDFVEAIHELDSHYIPYTLDSFSLKYHREWQVPLAREYHLIATKLGIDNWAGGGYVWFESGGKEEGYMPSQREKTRVYKIHLMPPDALMADFAYRLARIIQEDADLYNRIIYYKFIVRPRITAKNMPRVVLYTDGKEDTQIVLNKLYDKLKTEQGSGYSARFSAYVTDLIWVAQGDGDRKKDEQYQSDYEQPDLIYYKKDFTGSEQDYHLRHPLTGHDLSSPFAFDSSQGGNRQ